MATVFEDKMLKKAAELEARLDRNMIPRHVGVIMDGNGRWGLGHGMTREYGHRESVDAVRSTVTAADDVGVKYLSLFCFSTENTQRPSSEVASLFKLFMDTLEAETDELHRKNVRIITTGLVEHLPRELTDMFSRVVDRTKDNAGLVLNLCVMYSGRTEIMYAAQQMALKAARGEFDPEKLDEQSFRSFFFHPDVPDCDLVIRTSGEVRISNFLLWQMAYCELSFTDVLWPDFSRADFMAEMLSYQARNRRFGKV